MPNPGQANNPDGTNSWEGFGTEEPYGQATKDAALAAGAPLAGGKLAAGAISAPKKSQKQATQGAQTSPAAGPPTLQGLPAVPPPAQPSVADIWQAIASTPGAENHPVLQQMADQSSAQYQAE